MPKSPTYSTSAVSFDGAAPLFLSSGEITFSTTTQTGINFMVPWNCRIQRAYIWVSVAATATDLFMHIGNKSSNSAYYGSYRVVASTSNTMFTIEDGDANWVTQSVTAGQTVIVAFTTGATATVACTLVLNPNLFS